MFLIYTSGVHKRGSMVGASDRKSCRVLSSAVPLMQDNLQWGCESGATSDESFANLGLSALQLCGHRTPQWQRDDPTKVSAVN